MSEGGAKAPGSRARRIHKEIKDVLDDPVCKIGLEVVDGDLSHLKGTFFGPPDTPYEGGSYEVDIKIAPDYPFRPPTMKFKTKVWHPNISSQTGHICLDTLSTTWSPVLTMKSALISLQSLLASPEPKDPQDAVVASQMIKHPQEFAHKAKLWAQQYAGAPVKDDSGGSNVESSRLLAQKAAEEDKKALMKQYHGYNKDMIDRFVDMGFEVSRVVAAFEHFGIDKNDGQDYPLEEAYMGDVTAWLFGEV